LRGVRLVLDLKRVLPTALAALGDEQGLPLDRQIAQLLPGIDVGYDGTDGYRDIRIVAAVASTIVAAAALAVLTSVGARDPEIGERVHAFDRFQVDAAAEAAVAAVGSTKGHEFFAPKTHAAAAAVAGLHFKLGFVDEFHGCLCSKIKKGAGVGLPPSVSCRFARANTPPRITSRRR